MTRLIFGEFIPIPNAVVANTSHKTPLGLVNEEIIFLQTSKAVHASYLSQMRCSDFFMPGSTVT